MANVHSRDEAGEVAWKARALYLTAMGADIVDCPDMEAIRSSALELSEKADQLLADLEAEGSPSTNPEPAPTAKAA